MIDRESLIGRIKEGFHDMLYIWSYEMKQVFKDEGVLIFFILVPLLYPLLYSWAYNNEVVQDAPVVAVDQSHSSLSRDFLRRCDGTQGVKIVAYAADMEEAKEVMRQQGARGIIYIPSEFSDQLNRMEQTHVSIYTDMSGILYYKQILITTTNISLDLGADLQLMKLGNYTTREDEISTAPLQYEDIPMFNPAGGYGSFLLPAVLALILQQTLILGIGLSAGTAREENKHEALIPISRHYNGIFRIVFGKSICYFMIYAVIGSYITMVIPLLFHFPQLLQLKDLVAIMIPYLLACIFFGMTLSAMVRYRENVILLIVFTSLPLLFLSGISWPGSAIHGAWKGISYLFPSTFGVNAYVKMNNLGALLNDVHFEYRALWLQTGAYFFTACAVYRHQIILSHKRHLERKYQEEQRDQLSEYTTAKVAE